jgi:hypothetical protein
VEEGLPLVARICDLTLRPTAFAETQPIQYQFAAWLQYRDPHTGQVVMRETASSTFSPEAMAQLTTSFRVGDYVSAVYFREDPEKTLRLYGFLDLKPGLGLVRRDGTPEPTLVRTLLPHLIGYLFVGLVFCTVYAYARYTPVRITFRQGVVPFTLGAVFLGGSLLGMLAYDQRCRRRGRAIRNAQAGTSGEPVEDEPAHQGWFGCHGLVLGLVLTAGALGCGGATTLAWCFAVNALVDRSPPEPRPVRIDRMVMTTYYFVFRNYSIEYQLPDSQERHTLLSTPDEMLRFSEDRGIADVHAGWLGWPWVRTIRPVPPDRDLAFAKEPDRS